MRESFLLIYGTIVDEICQGGGNDTYLLLKGVLK